jgi:hypothetical protein
MEIFTKNSAKCTVFQSTICNKFSSLMSNCLETQHCRALQIPAIPAGKLQVQMTSGNPSSILTNFASVEVLVLRHYLQESEYTDPFPGEMVTLVWLLMFGCTVNDASIHHLIAMPSSISSVRKRSFDL